MIEVRRPPRFSDRIDEVEYISGIVAGLTTKSNRLGFVAANVVSLEFQEH
jgi:basic membrane lipoprotein Med (substrate-binding protein (PBP1-ABC) superfamily)